jgi:hypothetical protein
MNYDRRLLALEDMIYKNSYPKKQKRVLVTPEQVLNIRANLNKFRKVPKWIEPALDLYLEIGADYQKIADILNQQGYKPERGFGKFTRSNVMVGCFFLWKIKMENKGYNPVFKYEIYDDDLQKLLAIADKIFIKNRHKILNSLRWVYLSKTFDGLPFLNPDYLKLKIYYIKNHKLWLS